MENSPTPQPETEAEEQKTDIKKWIIIAVVVVFALIFLRTLFSPEKMSERAIERATDGEYDVEINRDGSMEISGGEAGDVNIVAGESATLPSGWPDSVPVLPDANIEYSAAVGDGEGETTYTVTYTTDQAVSEVVDFYRGGLEGNGWTIEVTMDTGDGSMLSASNDNDGTVVVNIVSADEGATVVISTQ